MDAQRKKKSGRLKRRMRGALARLGGAVRGRARDHVTDDAQGLVGNEQPAEIELDAVASTSEPEIETSSVVDQPKSPIFAKLVNATTKFGRRKSTSGSEGKGKRDRKKHKATRAQLAADVCDPMPSCSGIFESESDRLIAAEPEVEISTNDDVISAESPHLSAAILSAAQSEDGHQTKAEGEEKVMDHTADSSVQAGPGGKPEVDDVTRQDGDAKKHHRKRKRAKRYAKRVGIPFPSFH